MITAERISYGTNPTARPTFLKNGAASRRLDEGLPIADTKFCTGWGKIVIVNGFGMQRTLPSGPYLEELLEIVCGQRWMPKEPGLSFRKTLQ